jgi:hypothetical protein
MSIRLRMIRRAVLLVLPLALTGVAHAQAPAPKRPAVAKVTVPGAPAQEPVSTTIYKHVDDRGHVTYSNRPMKGAEVVDLEPISVISSGPRALPGTPPVQQASNFQLQQNSAPPVSTPLAAASGPSGAPMAASATLPTPLATAAPAPTQVALVLPNPTTVMPNVDASTQKSRDDSRRRILQDEMSAEQKLLTDAVLALTATESDRSVIEQMRQAAAKLTPAAYAEARRNYEAREEKLKSLQESVNTHEKNVLALKKELTALR